jgi:hypothetical protein
MEFPGQNFINPQLAMGLFALFVSFVSLARVMAEKEFPRLTAMKRIWGRRQGLLCHFLANVALPLVLGIVFLSRGIAAFGDAPRVAGIPPSLQVRDDFRGSSPVQAEITSQSVALVSHLDQTPSPVRDESPTSQLVMTIP